MREDRLDHLGDAYYGIRHDVDRLRNLYMEQGSRVEKIGNLCETVKEDYEQHFNSIHTDLEGLWNEIPPQHPPPPPVAPGEAPYHPYYRDPPY
ncbi:hypothetical protein Acr_25g0000230 [Actinidia rufa]|uniref:Uncharacterized protein n=1 Tax=Actinidia rufa TaxID=165716 RepID=A0A7J0GYL5_9ERIC|nr:hypothetical protein Acr_25g0000230 [Actinidia rufa]